MKLIDKENHCHVTGKEIMKYADNIPKSEYKKRITAIFAANSSCGFADWRQCGNLEMELSEFLEDAQNTLTGEGRYADLFDITCAAFFKWSSMDMDDDGETQMFGDCEKSVWADIYMHGEADLPHEKMLKWFLEQLEKHTVIDYMEDFLYDIILKYFKKQGELTLIKEMLNRIMADCSTTRYSMPVFEDYYIRVLADLKTPIEEIRSLVAKSGGYCIEDTLAQIEMEYGNFAVAKNLYEKHIAARPDSYWSNKPRKALIEIYKKTGDKDREFAEVEKFLWANVNSKGAFLQYKAYFSDETWPAEWERILDDPRSESAYVWFEIEDRYDLIMDLAEELHSANLVVEYEKKLSSRYPERCLAVLIKDAEDSAARAKKRSDYRYLAKDLKRISKYNGGSKAATQLAHKFAAEYPRRTAMLDELRELLK